MKIIGYLSPQSVSYVSRGSLSQVTVYAKPIGSATVPVFIDDGDKKPQTPQECLECIGRLQQEIMELTQKIVGDPVGVVQSKLSL